MADVFESILPHLSSKDVWRFSAVSSGLSEQVIRTLRSYPEKAEEVLLRATTAGVYNTVETVLQDVIPHTGADFVESIYRALRISIETGSQDIALLLLSRTGLKEDMLFDLLKTTFINGLDRVYNALFERQKEAYLEKKRREEQYPQYTMRRVLDPENLDIGERLYPRLIPSSGARLRMNVSPNTQPVTALLAALEDTQENFVKFLDSADISNLGLLKAGEGAIYLFQGQKFGTVLERLLPRVTRKQSNDPFDITSFKNTVFHLFEILASAGCPQCIAAYFEKVGTEEDNGESSVQFSSPESLMKALEYRSDLNNTLSVGKPVAFGPLLRAYRRGIQVKTDPSLRSGGGNPAVTYLMVSNQSGHKRKRMFRTYAYILPRRFLDLVYEDVDERLSEEDMERVAPSVQRDPSFRNIMKDFNNKIPKERLEEIGAMAIMNFYEIDLQKSLLVICRTINEGDASLARSFLYSSIFGRFCKTRYERKVFFASIVDCLVCKGWSEMLQEVLQYYSIARTYAKYYRGELLTAAQLFAPNNKDLQEIL